MEEEVIPANRKLAQSLEQLNPNKVNFNTFRAVTHELVKKNPKLKKK